MNQREGGEIRGGGGHKGKKKKIRKQEYPDPLNQRRTALLLSL